MIRCWDEFQFEVGGEAMQQLQLANTGKMETSTLQVYVTVSLSLSLESVVCLFFFSLSLYMSVLPISTHSLNGPFPFIFLLP